LLLILFQHYLFGSFALTVIVFCSRLQLCKGINIIFIFSQRALFWRIKYLFIMIAAQYLLCHYQSFVMSKSLRNISAEALHYLCKGYLLLVKRLFTISKKAIYY